MSDDTPQRPAESARTHRVLIVSDHRDDALILAEQLRKSGVGPFEIDRATTLAAGLARLRGGRVDAIVTDLSLPDSQGIGTFDQLFAAAPHTPIITRGTHDDERLGIEAVHRGAQGFLPKGPAYGHLVPYTLHHAIQCNLIEASLYRERSRADIALNSIGDAVICTDMLGNIDYLNVAAEHLTGWSREEARGQPSGLVFNIVCGSNRDPAPSPITAVLREDKDFTLNADTVLIRRDGHEIPIEDSAAPIYDWDGRITGVVMVFHDVSAARAMTMKIAYLAQHDFLTDLPNRVLLNDRIPQAIALAKRHGSKLALLFLDLDNFKHINDSLGHGIGDELLQSVAKRLTECVRSSDTVSRQGGDEFVILLAECHSEQDAVLATEKILAALAQPHATSTGELHVTASIGISVYPADGSDAETLMKNADMAMFHAKQTGRNTFQFFLDEMNIRAVQRQLTEAHLRHAIEKGECVLYYQPIVDLDTGSINGAEALLRWNHPEWGMVLPHRFVPIAEDCGLIVPIGRWVLREACEQAMRWIAAGHAPILIAVNISALEFRHRDFVDGVRAVLLDTGMDPFRLQLEITESVLMREAGASKAILEELKSMGVQLAVDDFGTGYSSLSYLQQFPIDILKIDRSFVQDLATGHGNRVIVDAVIGMGNSLGKRIVAEGVETESQLAFLEARHCDAAQGYLFSHPLSVEAFDRLMTKGTQATGVLIPPHPSPEGIDATRAQTRGPSTGPE